MKHHHKHSGFTLAELAIVLVIVGLLLGGLFMPLTAQMGMKNRTDTEKQLADIREALVGYAAVNGRLPCPADSTVATATSNAGLEAFSLTSGTCSCISGTSTVVAVGGTACSETAPYSSVTGVLPWATLGLPETDAWGSRFTYRVTTRFARLASGQIVFGCTPNNNPTGAAFALCSAGDIIVYTDSTLVTPLVSGIPAIVISHGKSNVGAWLPNGSQILPLSNASLDEQKNADGDASFVSNTNIDDQLIWISPNILMNRMIAAGKLP